MVPSVSINGNFKRILIISDTHFPAEHEDTFKFLSKIKTAYKPDLVVSIGDIVDLHNFSRYEHNPDWLSPSCELKEAKKRIKNLYSIFPQLYIVVGNHDERIHDRAGKAGLPESCLKSLDSILGTEKFKWKFCDNLKLNYKDEKKRILFTHGLFKNPIQSAIHESANVVQGHFHTSAEIRFGANSNCLRWGMNTGCLVKQSNVCFRYSKKHAKKFILGAGIVENNMPKYIPMLLKSNGKWSGRLF